MAHIAPVTSLPVGGPDSLLDTTPPGTIQLGATNGFAIRLTVSGGSVTLVPYNWYNGHWYPLGDSVTAPKSITANSATVADAMDRFIKVSEPGFWALLKTGAGTVVTCDIEEAVF